MGFFCSSFLCNYQVNTHYLIAFLCTSLTYVKVGFPFAALNLHCHDLNNVSSKANLRVHISFALAAAGPVTTHASEARRSKISFILMRLINS